VTYVPNYELRPRYGEQKKAKAFYIAMRQSEFSGIDALADFYRMSRSRIVRILLTEIMRRPLVMRELLETAGAAIEGLGNVGEMVCAPDRVGARAADHGMVGDQTTG